MLSILHRHRSSIRLLPLVAIVGMLFIPNWNGIEAEPDPAVSTAPNKYIGSGKCKSCHDSEACGNQYDAWKSEEHSNAFELLKSDEAKKVGKEHGVADPSKSDDCLKCHVTAFDVDKKLKKKSFKPEEGVGCEVCHGPGDAHARARFRAANSEEEDEGFGDEEAEAKYTEIPVGEIGMDISEDLCVKCHNKKSPTYQPFCFHCRSFSIRHLNPLKPRTAAEKKALSECGCGDGKKCDHDCSLDKAGAPK